MKALTAEERSARIRYAGRWLTPAQVERARTYQREWARRNPGKKHTWRRKNPDKARESARLSMQRLRDKDPVGRRAKHRKWSGLPEPTRPEPVVCDICGKPDPKGKTLHLDHDHLTGAFRGWLCDIHNRGLGYFQDDPGLLRKAANYLEAMYK